MFTFLASAVMISLSGVMAPGPITAATLTAGSRSRHAGALIALGHAVVETPLILLLAAGVGTFFASATAKTAIGLAGGLVLTLMAAQLLLSLRRPQSDSEATVQRHPLVTGIILTGANPYVPIWWATVGLALVTQAAAYGALALLVFGIVHWLCDVVWFEVLSQAAFRGSQVFGPRSQRVVSVVCAVVLLGFGLKFLFDAAISLLWPVH
jgi:threonine/homoserine/homoserine lactone efflux protein